MPRLAFAWFVQALVLLTAATGGRATSVAAQAAAATASAVEAEAFAPYLPLGERPELLAALRAATAAMGQQPAFSFVSAESSAASAEPIINRVSVYTDSRYDVYLMRQRQTAAEGNDPARWSLVGLLVGHSGATKTAYFLEFAPRSVAPGELPLPIQPRVPCYRCHANGPRLIRPLRSDLQPSLTAADLTMARAWNQRIRTEGPVQVYATAATTGLLRDGRPLANEVLTLPFCHDCHNGATGVRSELRRQHIGASRFLLDHGTDADGYAASVEEHALPAMPLDDRLSEPERRCLDDWFQGRSLNKSCLAKQHLSLAPVPPSSAALDSSMDTVDTAATELHAEVRTSVGGFTVTGLQLTGALAKATCAGELELRLDNGQTGSRVRDRHMQEQIIAPAGRPTIRVASADCAALQRLRRPSAGESHTTVTLPVVLQFNAHQRSVPVTWHTGPDGLDFAAAIDLRDFAVAPPEFLMLAVQPLVHIAGTVRWQRPQVPPLTSLKPAL